MSTAAASAPVPLNRRLKRWPGWVVLLGVVIVALLIGATRSTGPLTDEDRLDGIAQHIACPECEGESVYESQSPAAQNIRIQIKSLISQGTYSDDQIIAYVETNFGTKTQLVPKATGFDAVVWALPVFAGVCAIAGLTVAFRRWRTAADTVPTESDRALVDAALAEQDDEH
ncbi:MAG: ccmH [Acidimicrobiales bacterium]|nr:ccmH [Acidimicrobiales bacterium]